MPLTASIETLLRCMFCVQWRESVVHHNKDQDQETKVLSRRSFGELCRAEAGFNLDHKGGWNVPK